MSAVAGVASIAELRRSFDTTAFISGSTHRFYLYPARFHPDVARQIITTFSSKDECVLDPFMGGGTSVVEALTLGRRVVGNDINALARFVADVRTRPLSVADKKEVRLWAMTTANRLVQKELSWIPRVGIRNLPMEVEVFISGAIELARGMLPRRNSFARAVLLRLGQLAVDCRDADVHSQERLAVRLPSLVEEMLDGLDELVSSCRVAGISKNAIAGRRLLLNRSTVGLDMERNIRSKVQRPRLVLTSPPYPGVHVLYHRWQYRGRRETSAPYWIADVTDGSGAAYYCGGSRTATGLRSYFRMIHDAFTSIRRIMHPDGRVVQIVGFADARSQLPAYLDVMEQAGYEYVRFTELGEEPLQRRVANRKWYAKLKRDIDASREFMLVHRIRSTAMVL